MKPYKTNIGKWKVCTITIYISLQRDMITVTAPFLLLISGLKAGGNRNRFTVLLFVCIHMSLNDAELIISNYA